MGLLLTFTVAVCAGIVAGLLVWEVSPWLGAPVAFLVAYAACALLPVGRR